MILMQLNSEVLNRVTYLTGSADIAEKLPLVRAKVPFEDSIIDFLNDVSKELMSDKNAKAFSDVITFGFWIRKGSVLKLKERFENDNAVHLGKGATSTFSTTGSATFGCSVFSTATIFSVKAGVLSVPICFWYNHKVNTDNPIKINNQQTIQGVAPEKQKTNKHNQ